MTVPVAGAPSADRTPASASAPTFASVAVITPFTAVARSITASSTTTTLIVDGCHSAGGVTPAAIGIPSPTVATAPTRTPSASSHAMHASRVRAAVMSPTNGSAMPSRRANARRSRAGSAQ